MQKTILVTGGAGFIGSHVVDALIAHGHHVIVVDALVSQVHGTHTQQPRFLSSEATFIRADLCDREQWVDVLSGVDAVVHLAAEVGVGQSMYEIVRYVRGNSLATAVLLEALLEHRDHIGKIVVASSMSIYGEGAYLCPTCGVTYPRMRQNEHLQRHQWEMRCATCGEVTMPIPTSEEKPLYPTSIYAVTKRDHEEMCLTFGQA
jgi:dTDP-L-rhamnose 4-epimerase